MVEPCLATLVSFIVLSNNDILLINKSTINGLNFCVSPARGRDGCYGRSHSSTLASTPSLARSHRRCPGCRRWSSSMSRTTTSWAPCWRPCGLPLLRNFTSPTTSLGTEIETHSQNRKPHPPTLSQFDMEMEAQRPEPCKRWHLPCFRRSPASSPPSPACRRPRALVDSYTTGAAASDRATGCPCAPRAAADVTDLELEARDRPRRVRRGLPGGGRGEG
uniref:Uncharacterized protein n=1 Tax=Oryza sativa subsp. japonica TaxID=39947 RepID=Q6YWH1_ORYSJ|nr:hypothetical protein [Oryza sativa Japonica Group]BAD16384.1 hypothetical protein [Oryza sativa Japonica Group]